MLFSASAEVEILRHSIVSVWGQVMAAISPPFPHKSLNAAKNTSLADSTINHHECYDNPCPINQVGQLFVMPMKSEIRVLVSYDSLTMKLACQLRAIDCQIRQHPPLQPPPFTHKHITSLLCIHKHIFCPDRSLSHFYCSHPQS